jgi:hypothetical protein
LLSWAWLLFLPVKARSQTFTIWNESGENIWSIGMCLSANGLMAGDWGLPSINNAAGPITIQSSYFASPSTARRYVLAHRNLCLVRQWPGPWPSQTWGGGPNAVLRRVRSERHDTERPHVYTAPKLHQFRMRHAQNNTSNPQYYQFRFHGRFRDFRISADAAAESPSTAIKVQAPMATATNGWPSIRVSRFKCVAPSLTARTTRPATSAPCKPLPACCLAAIGGLQLQGSWAALRGLVQ